MCQTDKIKVVHFSNGSGGGVLSVIKNLVEFSNKSEIENHVIYSIERSKKPTIIPIPGAKSVKNFVFDRDWNFYHTCHKLRKLIPDERTVLIAHDWLELGLVSQLGLTNPLIQFLHGDYEYYYNLAKLHKEAINHYICVSSVIEEKLKNQLTDRVSDISFLKFPIPFAESLPKIRSNSLKLIYCVRDLNESIKRFFILPEINNLLKKKGVEVNWIVIGNGRSTQEIKKLLGSDTKYYPTLSNEEVISEMQKSDILLLPSSTEGFPVVVVEGMKSGLVPLITDWDGATKELVKDGETGFLFEKKEIERYSSVIEKLSKDRPLLNQISKNAINTANKLFDPYENTHAIERLIKSVSSSNSIKRKTSAIYGSRLDKKWIPNFIVSNIRKNIKHQDLS